MGWVEPALPSHAALQALKGIVYFGEHGTLAPILVLLAWIGGAVVAHLLAHLVGRRAPHPPLLGGRPALPAAG